MENKANNIPKELIEVPLSNGTVAIVDSPDYELVKAHNWHSVTFGANKYAIANVKKNGRWTTLRMHRLIMNPPPSMDIDHKNHNGLDNRRSNLRVCTRSQNAANGRKPPVYRSKYRGVSFHKNTTKWRVRVAVGRKAVYTGWFADEQEAARAYDIKAKEIFGEFAKTNF